MATPRVCLLVETSREYGRGILRGVIRYQQKHGPWSVYFKPQGLDTPPPRWLSSWEGDGILARINDRRMARVVGAAGVPVVDLRNALPDLDIPTVAMDNLSVVRLGVDHLEEQGFRNFAFCGTPLGENRNQDERAARFKALVEQRGHRCEVYAPGKTRGGGWEAEQRNIIQWLRSLPRPVAVMTCHDDRGLQVMDACLRAGLHVPEEVAILGVDNDPFLCNLSTPQLSSIDGNAERVGYEAAKLLASMMKGGGKPKKPILIEARGVVMRQSTVVTAVDDPHVAHACRLIREHTGKATGLDELLRKVPVSRSALFRRFKESLGRSPKKEMTRIRLQRARELLSYTTQPIEEVARNTFRTDAKHFITTFAKEVGQTPLQFRKRYLSL
jgi:LacI family transcriptional regulator